MTLQLIHNVLKEKVSSISGITSLRNFIVQNFRLISNKQDN